MKNNKKNFQQILYEGELIKKLNTTSGKFNNEAYLYKWLGNYYVVRKIGKQYDLSNSKLNVLKKSINTYYEFLKKNKTFNLSKIFFTKIDKRQNIILLVTEYFPKGKVVKIENVSQRIKYFKTIAVLIIKLASSRNNLYLNKLICSIDPNPNNFFIDSKGELIYNDFTPPLYRENGKWIEFRRKDELHAKKSDKEKRYFTGFNLLLVFINKTRIYLPFTDYLKFNKWLLNEIIKSKLSNNNDLKQFSEIFNEIYIEKIVDFSSFEKYAVKRDLSRFSLSFNKNLTSLQIKEIYKESKKPSGIDILFKTNFKK